MTGLDFSFASGLLLQLAGVLPVTLGMSFLAMALALALAIVFAVVQIFRIPGLNAFTQVYISFFRGTPLLVQLFLFYYGLPQVLPEMTGITAFQATTLVLGLHFSAYMAELIRGAILGVDRSQMEASLSVGMDRVTAMRRIILPQAARIAVPGLMNSFIDLLKSTSLAFTVGVAEIMAKTQLEAASSFRFLESYLVLALVYWVVIVLMTWAQKHTEKRLAEAY